MKERGAWAVVAEVTDAVCGVTFDEETAEEMGAFRVVHEGRTHWFCSSTCRDEFVKRPAQYGP